ncbi:uncharacterized protein LOC116502910 isoform X2 [Thamnophis elegans]|nr:uncharacterized protein LOC116502910 isoform X2 [Thamnophis elegans]
MEKENGLLKPSWIDEGANELKPVVRSSYPKKILFLIVSLVIIVLMVIIALLSVNGLGTRYPFGNNMTPAADPIKEEAVPKNLTVSILQEAQKSEPLCEDMENCFDRAIKEFVSEPQILKEKAVPKNLTVSILQEAQKSEPFSEAMGNCFDKAIKEFVSEPQIVKENAKMVLECDGTRREFVSGKGENSIEVFWVDGQTHYTVREANSQVYIARLGRRELPLSLGSLLNVYQQLASPEGQELQQCLDKVIEKFPKEPQTLQDNAVLQVSCGGSNVTFRSEAGTNEINVYKDTQGEIVYNVKARGRAWWDRLFKRS